MHLTELLSADRVAIERMNGSGGFTKPLALTKLATMLANGTKLPVDAIERVLNEREHLQSTGIGEGVANLLFAVIGPKRATGEHLKTLARVSRLLRSREFRDRLVGAPSAASAYALIANEEGEKK